VIALAFCAGASVAHAQVFKCIDATGKTTYSDAPCAAGVTPYKLPEDPTKGTGTSPRACAQMHDEMLRLATEADRAAKRGAAESADNAKSRRAMTKQYEARCVGISRTEPRQK